MKNSRCMIMINRLLIIQTCNHICFDASKMSSTTSNLEHRNIFTFTRLWNSYLVMIFDRNFHYTIQLHLVIISSSRKEPCGLWYLRNWPRATILLSLRVCPRCVRSFVNAAIKMKLWLRLSISKTTLNLHMKFFFFLNVVVGKLNKSDRQFPI